MPGTASSSQPIHGNYVDGHNHSKRIILNFTVVPGTVVPNAVYLRALNLVCKTSMRDLEVTLQKIECFRTLGYTVQVLWECEFHQQLANNPEMKGFVSNFKYDTTLEPCHGFLVVEQMLFPFTGKLLMRRKFIMWILPLCTLGPTGTVKFLLAILKFSRAKLWSTTHPTIFFRNDECKILPSSFLFHPLLPYRGNGKLIFLLCRTCAENLQQTLCEPSKKECTLPGTWPSIEIQKTCELSYGVVRLI